MTPTRRATLPVRAAAVASIAALVLVGCGGDDTADEPATTNTTAAGDPTGAATSADDPVAPAAGDWDGVTDDNPGTVTLAGTVFTMETVTHCGPDAWKLEDRSGINHKIEANGGGLQINFDFNTPTDDVGVPLLLVSITPSDDPQVIIDVIGQPGVFAPEGLPMGVPSGGRIVGESEQDGIAFSWDVGVPANTPVEDTDGFECL